MKLNLGILFGALALASTAHAIDFIQTNQFSETNVLTQETWVSAQAIDISGTASNDLFASGTTVDLNGTFHGDAWAIGKNISAAGTFRDDLRLIAQTTQLFGTQHGSVALMGSTIKIDSTAMLHNDLVCLGESIILEGTISGDVRIIAQRATLGGEIDGDIFIIANEIVCLPGTVLNGDLTYTAPNELVLSSAVTLQGELTRTFSETPTLKLLREDLAGHFFFGFAALIAGLAFISLFPHYTGAALYTLSNSRGLCSIAGFSGLFLLPMISLILLFTLIGLPLSILILLFYLILLYLSKIIVALWIGTTLLKSKSFSKRSAAAPLALGLLILYALTSFTVASWAINLLTFFFGLGALLIALFKKPVFVIQKQNNVNENQKEN